MGGQSTRSSGDEIVLIDFEPRKVLVESLEGQEIHYFFWNLDLYKPFDYEPVKVEKLENGPHVYTRYHWKGLVMWTSPRLHRGKPLLSVALGVHTPLIHSTNWLFHLIYCVKELSMCKRFMLGSYITVFNALLTGKLSVNDPERFRGYGELTVDEPVLEKYRFRLDDWDFLIIVGAYSRTLPKDIEKRLESCSE